MSVYLITYDLHQPVRRYDALYSFFRNKGAAKVLESVYLWKTDESVDYVSTAVAELIDTNDEYVVTEITDKYRSRIFTK